MIVNQPPAETLSQPMSTVMFIPPTSTTSALSFTLRNSSTIFRNPDGGMSSATPTSEASSFTFDDTTEPPMAATSVQTRGSTSKTDFPSTSTTHTMLPSLTSSVLPPLAPIPTISIPFVQSTSSSSIHSSEPNTSSLSTSINASTTLVPQPLPSSSTPSIPHAQQTPQSSINNTVTTSKSVMIGVVVVAGIVFICMLVILGRLHRRGYFSKQTTTMERAAKSAEGAELPQSEEAHEDSGSTRGLGILAHMGIRSLLRGPSQDHFGSLEIRGRGAAEDISSTKGDGVSPTSTGHASPIPPAPEHAVPLPLPRADPTNTWLLATPTTGHFSEDIPAYPPSPPPPLYRTQVW